MGFLDKLGSFLKREAKDIGEAAEGVKDKLDEELTKREEELAMTPSEKIAALQEKATLGDDKLDRIADKALGREAMAEAVAEVGDVSSETELPNVTHIVLADGDEAATADEAAEEKASDHESAAAKSDSSDVDQPAESATAEDSAAPQNAAEAADAAEAAAGGPKAPSATNYDKTPAQIKYEQARAAADDLLKELRGELKDDGEI